MTRTLRKLVCTALVLGVSLMGARVTEAQCLQRLFNRPTTYTAGYGGYPVGVAYAPVTTYMPVVSPPPPVVTSYRVTYLPVTPGVTTVYRAAPAVAAPIIGSPSSQLAVATPYAVASPSVQPTMVPVVTYRPVQIVYEPRRRLFSWRPIANWRARRAGYWPATTGTTWSTAYLTSYTYIPAATTATVCSPVETGLPMTASGYQISGSSSCASCVSSTTSSWQGSTAPSISTLPSASSATAPPPTFKQESPDTETRMKPAEESKTSPRASGTSLPLSEGKPFVRQALYEKPIPLVEDESDPPLVEVHGWRRSQ